MGEAVTGALTTAMGFVGTILDAITGNAVLAVLFASGVLIPAAIGVFRKVKGAAR